MIRTPLPRQQNQTYPLHALQRTFLLSCSLVVFPLYKSSKETLQNKNFPLITYFILADGKL
uniref:Uncharacterized protein n=1 Tax=Meleagris gallopavo TaxID=9103 RepID=A0A803XPE9_MELGA